MIVQLRKDGHELVPKKEKEKEKVKYNQRLCPQG